MTYKKACMVGLAGGVLSGQLTEWSGFLHPVIRSDFVVDVIPLGEVRFYCGFERGSECE